MTLIALQSPLSNGQEADRLAAVMSYAILDTPPDPAFDDLVQLAAVIAGTPVAAMNLIDDRRTWAKATIGVPQGFEAPREGAFCFEAISSPTEILVITNTLVAERHAESFMTKLGVRFYTGVPLVTLAGHAIGTLCVSDNEPRARPTDVQLAALRTLAIAVTAHLDLRQTIARAEQLTAELEHLALHDPLTRIANRRSLDQGLAREMARAARSGRPVSIVLLDLDHFKRLNDTQGHIAGDRMLLACADAWRDQIRTTDLLARYGGEEFAVVLTDASPEEAAAMADRLRAVMPAAQTCSAGVATWCTEETSEELFERADRALYAAKAAGRNATRVAGPQEHPPEATSRHE